MEQKSTFGNLPKWINEGVAALAPGGWEAPSPGCPARRVSVTVGSSSTPLRDRALRGDD